MRNVKSASRASRVSTASGIRNLLDEFDCKTARPPEKTATLLFPPEHDPQYEALVKTIAGRRTLRPVDYEAIKIQKTWRMYRIKRHYAPFLRAFRANRLADKRRLFRILLLNSLISRVDRREYYKDVQSGMGFSPTVCRGHVQVPNEVFAATGMMAVPTFMDPEKLVKFTRLCNRSVIARLFDAWRIRSRISHDIQKAQMDGNFEAASLKMFKGVFVCFQMWRRFVQFKKPVRRWRDPIRVQVPHWKNFEAINGELKRQQAKATALRTKNIQENALQALRFLVHNRKQMAHMKAQQEKYSIRRTMRNALNKWIQYVVLEQNKVVSSRFFFRKWLQRTQRRKHLIMLEKKLSQRHQYWIRRQIMAVFYKNWKVQPILSTFSYLKIHQKPSLALYFIAILRKDVGSMALCHSLRAWIDYVRRKRRWELFVFKNQEMTEYVPLKRRVLAGFRRHPVPTVLPVSLYSDYFKTDSMQAYTQVMSDSLKTDTIFLLVSGDAPASMKPPTNSKEQRKSFFKMWLQQPKDVSLFMRAAIVYVAKRKTQKLSETDRISERCYLQYKKAIAYLAEMNLASDGKFAAVRRTININNKRSLGNRQRCAHRDNLLLLAEYSHDDAVVLHDTRPLFRPEDQMKIFEKIQRATEDLIQSFEPLVPLSALGSILEQPNVRAFAEVRGCRANLLSFTQTIHDTHADIDHDLIRSALDHDTSMKFDRFLTKNEKAGNTHGGARTNLRSDPFNKNRRYVPARPRPMTGLSNRLLESFPLMSRKPRVIAHSSHGERGTSVANVGRRSEMSSSDAKIDLSEGKSSDVIFFSGLRSFTSLLSSASKQVFNLESDDVEPLLEDDEDRLMTETQREKENMERRDAPSIESTEIDASLVEGFDKNIMLSLKQAQEIASPRTAKKYKIFLEILFGRNARDQNNAFITNLRNKILEEYNNRKGSLSACGVVTSGLVRPVSNLVEEYRTEHIMRKKDDEELELEQMLNQPNQKNGPEDEKMIEVKYNARRFRPPHKKRRRHHHHDDQEELSDSDEDITSSSQTKSQSRRGGTGDKNRQSNTSNTRGTSQGSATGSKAGKSSGTSGGGGDRGRRGRRKSRASGDLGSGSGSYYDESYESSSDDSFREDLMDDDRPRRRIATEDGFKTDEQSDEIADTDFDAAAVEDARRVEAEKERERLVRSTPYAANKADKSVFGRVNKVVFKILQRNIREESRIGALVDVDQDGMAPFELSIPEHGANVRRGLNTGSSKGPSYRTRNWQALQLKKHKRLGPMVITSKHEVTKDMRDAITESKPFARITYSSNASTPRPMKEFDVYTPYMPAYKLDLKGQEDFTGLHFPDASQVVSFRSGSRQQGTETSNFTSVRITSGKNRSITRPIATPLKKPDTSQRPATQLAKHRAGFARVKNVVGELIRMMAASDDRDVFEAFRLKAKLAKKKYTRVGGSDNDHGRLATTEFYSRLQSIYINYVNKKSLRDTVTYLIKLAKSFEQFIPLLNNVIEEVVQEEVAQKRRTNQPRLTKDTFKPDMAAHYVDLSWMTEGPLRYNAIAVQYNEETLNRPTDIDAIISRTEPSAPRTPSRQSRLEYEERPGWDDVIRDYDLNEMMLCTPYVVPESQVDAVIASYGS